MLTNNNFEMVFSQNFIIIIIIIFIQFSSEIEVIAGEETRTFNCSSLVDISVNIV